ncbi:MAG TPA: Flp family type IVb pilin [Actinomycetota bacterium]
MVRDTALRAWVRAATLLEELRSERGATAVEYALMVALIALVVVAAVTFMGQATNNAYENSELVGTLGS